VPLGAPFSALEKRQFSDFSLANSSYNRYDNTIFTGRDFG